MRVVPLKTSLQMRHGLHVFACRVRYLRFLNSLSHPLFVHLNTFSFGFRFRIGHDEFSWRVQSRLRRNDLLHPLHECPLSAAVARVWRSLVTPRVDGPSPG